MIDAKSGVSGAGREPTHGKHFVSVDETVTPYKVGRHRHTPEIEQELGGDVRITFTPHLVPLSHGELVSCYVLADAQAVDAAALYREAYAGEPWVEVVEGPPGMQEVRETNFCRISVHDDERTGRVIVFATIDNLCKGTSSQAVQNLNLMFGRRRVGGAARIEPLGHRCPTTCTELDERPARRLPRRGRGLRAQALRRPRPGAAGLRRARHGERGALHALRACSPRRCC